MHIFNDNRKYLLVIAILILVGFCFYFNYAFRAHEDTLLREKTHEKQQDIALLAGIIDKLVEIDDRTGHYHEYSEMVLFAVQFIEINYHSTFAQAYDAELNPLTSLHPGVGGGQKHNPLDYPEFVYAVRNNESGSLTYTYETPEAGNREVHMTFQWVPTDPGHAERYLIAIGISKFTISESIDKLAIYGAVALIVVAALFIVGGAALIVRLGNIYDQRKGEKWRSGGQ